MEVVYVSDENYMPYVRTSAATLLKVNPDAHITVVSPAPVETEFNNVVIPLTEQYRQRKTNERITQTTYLKLFLIELPYDKILFIDPDTIIQKPLNELWNTDVKYLGMCESHDAGKTQADDLGIEKYAISGVMLMNLKNLRKIGFTKKCLSAKADPKLWCHEETLINVAMQGKIDYLPVKWNYCHKRDYGNRTLKPEDVAILHICGKDKSFMNYVPYDEIRQVKNFIKGKSVALVGNAKSIFDGKHGKDIDAHDVVIRFNRGFITAPDAQGAKTDILILACELNLGEKASYKAYYSINRSGNTRCVDLTLGNITRSRLRAWIGKQPSSGFMAIDLCREADAAKIDLYGFDFEKTPTFYNPEGYITHHDYNTEEIIVRDLEKRGILTIHENH